MGRPGSQEWREILAANMREITRVGRNRGASGLQISKAVSGETNDSLVKNILKKHKTDPETLRVLGDFLGIPGDILTKDLLTPEKIERVVSHVEQCTLALKMGVPTGGKVEDMRDSDLWAIWGEVRNLPRHARPLLRQYLATLKTTVAEGSAKNHPRGKTKTS